MKNPYTGNAPSTFWKTGVTAHQYDEKFSIFPDLYKKKFEINNTSYICTSGSCFAQHIHRNLKRRNFKLIDEEPAPKYLAFPKDYGFDLYSARYGNIYSSRQLLQLLEEALGINSWKPVIWQRSGSYFDALRPTVEPDGLPSNEHVHLARSQHLEAVRRLVEKVDVFIFTMGLTETWLCTESGRALPTAPGVVAGEFNPSSYKAWNMNYIDILADMKKIISIIRQARPYCKFIFTVSPVPLVATFEDRHILSSTIYSKSTLRAVAGDLQNRYEFVDYFPSYEIITGIQAAGRYFENNLREVNERGVSLAMNTFIQQFWDPSNTQELIDNDQTVADLVCDEELVEREI